MSLKFSQGIYAVKNPEKYVGPRAPRYRSSWELVFCQMCDTHPSIEQWASENVRIPYKDPLTGRATVYIPDFFIVYVDKNNKKHAELIEIKPSNQMLKEKVGKNPYNQAQYVKNMAKWQVATEWARQHGMNFRVLNENDIFHTGGNKR
jgi:hypothetical protein